MRRKKEGGMLSVQVVDFHLYLQLFAQCELIQVSSEKKMSSRVIQKD
jgi:hypothetical protein